MARVLSLTLALVVCPIATGQVQYSKLYPADGVDHSYFGDAIAISGTTIAVGASHQPGPANTPGAVYLYSLTAGSWQQEAKLSASGDLGAGVFFGTTIAMDGPRLLVGSSLVTGMVFAFEKVGLAWVSDGAFASFGSGVGLSSIALHGDLAVIGDHGDNQGQPYSGAAFVFLRTSTGWQQEAKLKANDPSTNAIFGISSAIEGGTIVVGAKEESSAGPFAGAVYIFEQNAGVWTQQAKLLPPSSDPYQHFGMSVSISGDRIAVGAPGGAVSTNAAHVFVRTGGGWALEATLPGTGTGPEFGNRVALEGDRLLVGAAHETTAAGQTGAAFLYRRTASGWVQQGMLVPSDAVASDYFGISVGLDGDTAVVGSLLTNGAAMDSGAAYVFAVNDAQVTPRAPCFGPSLPGSLTAPAGAPHLGGPFKLVVSDPTNAAGLPPVSTLTTLAISLAPAAGFPCGTPVPGWGTTMGHGAELLVSVLPQHLFYVGALKFWLGPAFGNEHSISIPADATLVGLTAFAQGVFLTTVPGGLQFVLSDGLDLLMGF